MNSESFIAMEITNDDISDWLSSEIQFKCLRGVRTENEDHDWLRNTDDRCQSGIGRELEVIGDAGNGGGESMMSSMIRKNCQVKMLKIINVASHFSLNLAHDAHQDKSLFSTHRPQVQHISISYNSMLHFAS